MFYSLQYFDFNIEIIYGHNLWTNIFDRNLLLQKIFSFDLALNFYSKLSFEIDDPVAQCQDKHQLMKYEYKAACMNLGVC